MYLFVIVFLVIILSMLIATMEDAFIDTGGVCRGWGDLCLLRAVCTICLFVMNVGEIGEATCSNYEVERMLSSKPEG